MLAHRGPDDVSVLPMASSRSGHTRLSIIDVAAASSRWPRRIGRLWITFNGEIFNYVELREELVKPKGIDFARIRHRSPPSSLPGGRRRRRSTD